MDFYNDFAQSVHPSSALIHKYSFYGDSQGAAQNEKKHYAKMAVVALLIFLAGFGTGMSAGIGDVVRGDSGDVEISKVIDLYSKTRSSDVSFDQFWAVWDKIKEKYVSKPVDDVDLFYGSIAGMVQGLHDPYSVYFPPPEAEAFAKDLSGEFEGIGAEIGLRQGQLTVISPLPGSPAEQAGLLPGDAILSIEGQDTYDMTLDEAVMNIRGKKGTSVTLQIAHDGFETVEDVSITRDTINVPTVDWNMKNNGVAYLRISYFNETTWSEFDKAVNEMIRE